MLEEDIYLIPVRLEHCDLPDELTGFQALDLFESDWWPRLEASLKGVLKDNDKFSNRRSSAIKQPGSSARAGATLPLTGLLSHKKSRRPNCPSSSRPLSKSGASSHIVPRLMHAAMAASLVLLHQTPARTRRFISSDFLTPTENPEMTQAFLERLRERGHVVGQNLQIEYHYSRAGAEQIPACHQAPNGGKPWHHHPAADPCASRRGDRVVCQP